MKVNVTEEMVRDLVTTAFEGGINYWVEKASYDLALGCDYEDFQHKDNSETGKQGKFAPEDYRPTIQNIPFGEGCSVFFVVNEPFEDDDDEDGVRKHYRLDRASMRRGLELMVSEAPKHFQDLMDENYDAITADVFIQLCVFGEIVYG